MKVVFSARYRIDIGPHVFPTEKYGLVHDRLAGDTRIEFLEPEPAAWEQLARVHTPAYLDGIRGGTLAPETLARLELPWSSGMVDGFRLMVGGTILAARAALAGRAACHVGGGLHHAFPGHGEGFCPFNDVAVAIRVLQDEGIDRHAVVDLDVHHGNGTAFVFNHAGAPAPPPTGPDRTARAGDPRVFTFSMHQQHNYPMWKPRGSLDLGLPDGARDATYLNALQGALPQVLAHRPQCVFYLAGADPYEDDQLGGLRLTKQGLRARDRMVVEAAAGAGIPLVVVLAGGYARRVEDTVAIHCATIEEALRAADQPGGPPSSISA